MIFAGKRMSNFKTIVLWSIVSIFQDSMSEDFDPTTHPNWSLLEHERCGLSQADRIVGGKNASLGAYPWIARLGYTSEFNGLPSFKCGGAVISKFVILTAAHCVPEDLRPSMVRLGEHNVLTDPDCDVEDVCADPVQDYNITEIITHEEYNNPEFKHDIALLKLDREITFTDWVMPICMIHGSLLNKDHTGDITEVAGWGYYDMADKQTSLILQTIKLPVQHIEVCIAKFTNIADIGPTQLCVGGIKGEDSCNGDSGGPLMYVDQIDGIPKYYQIGLVSFGTTNCGGSTTPGIYTRLSSYLNWVLDHLKS